MNQTLSLTKDPIPSLIKKIAIPASVGTFFQTMFNIVDTFFAGKISPEALSALAKSFPIYFIIIAACVGVTVGGTSLVANSIGAVFGVFLAQRLANRPLTIIGNGQQTRDFIYVSDLVEGIYKAAKSNKQNKIYNIGGGKEVTVNKIAKLIGGKKIYIPKRPGEPDRSLADISRIKKDLNWKPKITIEKGVKNLLQNIHYWKNAPVWTPKTIKEATKIWFKYLSKN